MPVMSKEYYREYRQKHKDRLNALQRKRRAENHDKVMEYWNKYKQNNIEKIKARRKAYYQKNKAKTSVYNKEWARTNKDKIAQYSKKYRENNLEKRKEADKLSHYKHRTEISIKNGRRAEFSPNQDMERRNLSYFEKRHLVAILASAQPQARGDNSSSSRKGVSYNKKKGVWEAYLSVNGNRIIRRFKTEEEAIVYRVYLEDTYYTAEQKAIRDKYSKI